MPHGHVNGTVRPPSPSPLFVAICNLCALHRGALRGLRGSANPARRFVPPSGNRHSSECRKSRKGSSPIRRTPFARSFSRYRWGLASFHPMQEGSSLSAVSTAIQRLYIAEHCAFPWALLRFGARSQARGHRIYAVIASTRSSHPRQYSPSRSVGLQGKPVTLQIHLLRRIVDGVFIHTAIRQHCPSAALVFHKACNQYAR